MNLPIDFVQQIHTLLGQDEAIRLADAIQTDAPVSIRLNEKKCKEVLSSRMPLQGQVPWCPMGYYLDRRPAFTFDPLWHAGLYYVQEASSMFLQQALCRYADMSHPLCVLDLCASPGGKSTHLRSLLTDDSLLISNEIVRTRAQILAENMMRWGHPSVVVTNSAPDDFTPMEASFDLVLADVPCSGEGMFRKSEEARQQWSEAAVAMCAERQVEIALNAFRALRRGGIFIYSTCTFNRTEDEEVLRRIGAELGDELCESADVDADASWGVVTGREGVFRTFRFFPHRVEGEGMFLAVARRAGEAERVRESRNRRSVLAAVDARTTKELSRWIDSPKPMRFMAAGDTLYGCYAGRYDDIALLSGRMAVIYSGVAMGQIFKGALRPDGALALFADVSREAVPCRDLSAQEALRFLRKQDMDAAAFEQGVNMVTCGGLPLGFVKRIGARVNNMYPNSLRILK